MHVITAADAPTFEFGNVRFTALAAPSRGSGGLCTWQIALPPGHRSEAGHTLDQDEVFMVTAGRIRIAPDSPVLAAGDAVVVPAGVSIQISNAGDEEATAYVAIRAGFVPVLADGSTMDTPPWAR